MLVDESFMQQNRSHLRTCGLFDLCGHYGFNQLRRYLREKPLALRTAPLTWPRRCAFSLCPFGGYYKHKSPHGPKEPEPTTRFVLPMTMVAGPPGGETSVREKRLCLYARSSQGFVSCNVEECAFSLGTQAQDHVWDLAEYKRVKPAHCLTGVTSGGTGGERKRMWAYHPLCFRESPRGGAKS
jgi:hypothetical protein